MESIPALDDPLGNLFTGKRRWPRVPCSRRAFLEGATAPYAGHVVDISKGGVLFAIEDESFNPGGEDGVRAVEKAFPNGPTLVFPVEGIRAPATVVRMTTHDDRWVALGCEFAEVLTDAEAALLGVRIARLKHAEAHLADLPHAALPEARLSLLVFAEGSAIVGPCLLLEARAAGTQIIEGRTLSPAAEPLGLAEILTGYPLRLVLVEGKERLFEGSAHLVEVRAPDSGGRDRATVRLLCGEDLPPAVVARFAKW